MRVRIAIGLFVAMGLAVSSYAQKPGDRPVSARELLVPRLFVATGPSTDADLDRLRSALSKLPGITKVEARVEFGAVTVVIDGEGGSQSVFAATAKTVGFVLRPAPVRSFAAIGPNDEEHLGKLRASLEGIHGVDKVELSALPTGAAVQITGVMPGTAVVSAGEATGFKLDQLASYVVSGSSVTADLARLRSALKSVPGVNEIELQGLTGGATLLIHGDAKPPQLVMAAKASKYALWPLSAASGPRQFRVGGTVSDSEQLRLQEVVHNAGGAEIRKDPDGIRLIAGGDSMHQVAVVAAVTKAGFTLYSAEPVSLPSLIPETGRNTPPDVESGGIEGQAMLGGPAPDFTLVAKDGTSKVNLHDLIGKKPVVLVFGSCT